jgi:hypothetical protein
LKKAFALFEPPLVLVELIQGGIQSWTIYKNPTVQVCIPHHPEAIRALGKQSPIQLKPCSEAHDYIFIGVADPMKYLELSPSEIVFAFFFEQKEKVPSLFFDNLCVEIKTGNRPAMILTHSMQKGGFAYAPVTD